MYSYIYEYFIYPLYHFIKNDGQMRAIRELNRIKKLPPEARRTLQMEKLEKLLVHAFDNIPYYRNLFRREGIARSELLKKFVRIPPINKQLIRKNQQELIFPAHQKQKKLFPDSTSGSTGEKLQFYLDKCCLSRRMAMDLYELEMMGLRQGDPIAKLWGAPMDLKLATSVRGRLHSKVTRILTLSTYNLSDSSMEQYCRILTKFKPKLLVSYPSPLVEFCKFLEKKSIRLPSIKAVVASAETLYSWQKELTEKILGCRVFNRYGCREFGDIAQEFSYGNGLHCFNHRVVVEILDSDLQPCAVGKSGDIYITDLDNYGMPFIRYHIGDCGRWANKDGENSELGWPLLAEIEGRTFDIVRAPNGNRLGGTFWTILLKAREGIRQCQVYQKSLDSVTIRYIPDDDSRNLSAESRKYFAEKIIEACGGEMKIEFQKVEIIETTHSGKTRIVISDVADA